MYLQACFRLLRARCALPPLDPHCRRLCSCIRGRCPTPLHAQGCCKIAPPLACPLLQGFAVNPCNSKLHPSVTEAGIEPESEEELSVQEAYTPESTCWGCGEAPAQPA